MRHPIPGAFPPVKIEVEANGVTYDEMHVDGGTTNQVFVYPPALDWREYLDMLEVEDNMNIYVMRNSQVLPRRRVIDASILPIAKRIDLIAHSHTRHRRSECDLPAPR